MKIPYRFFQKNNFRLFTFVAVIMLAILTPITILAANSSHSLLSNAAGLNAKQRTRVFYPIVRSRPVCQKGTSDTAHCFAKVVVDNTNNPIVATSPKDLRQRILKTFAPDAITPTSAA